MICGCNISGIGYCYNITGFCRLVISGIYFIRIGLQRIGAGSRRCRLCHNHHLCLFSVSKRLIILNAIVQIRNKVIGILAGPYDEFHHISDVVFQLEAFTHVPMHSTIRLGICGSSTAICLTGGPLLLVGIAIAVLVVCTAVPIVLETAGIYRLHHFHLGICQRSDTVSDLHITKAEGRLDGFRDRLEGVLHCCVVGSNKRMIRSHATLGSQVTNLRNVIGNADGIKVFVCAGDGLDLVYRIVKVEPGTIIITFTKDLIFAVVLVCCASPHIQIVVRNITTAHTEGGVTIRHKYYKRGGIAAHFHFVGDLQRLFPVGTSVRTESIYGITEGIIRGGKALGQLRIRRE